MMREGELIKRLKENSIGGRSGPLDVDGDGDTEVEIPEDLIVEEFGGGFVLIHDEELLGGYAIVNRREFRDTVSKDAQFAFPGAITGTLALGVIGAPVGHTVGAWVGHLRHERILEAMEEHQEQQRSEE